MMEDECILELETLVLNMERCANMDDYEVAHDRADHMLLDLIDLLSDDRTGRQRQLVRRIKELYETVGKWYA